MPDPNFRAQFEGTADTARIAHEEAAWRASDDLTVPETFVTFEFTAYNTMQRLRMIWWDKFGKYTVISADRLEKVCGF